MEEKTNDVIPSESLVEDKTSTELYCGTCEGMYDGKIPDEEFEKNNPDFWAKVKYLPAEEGGLKAPLYSKRNWIAPQHLTEEQGIKVPENPIYTTSIKIDGYDKLTSCEQYFPGKTCAVPGNSLWVTIKMHSPEIFKNGLFEGQHFQIIEATNIIATGKILEVFNKDLEDINHPKEKITYEHFFDRNCNGDGVWITPVSVTTLCATQMERSGNLKGALEEYNYLIEILPSGENYFRRGHVKQLLGDNVGSKSDFYKAIESDPDLSIAYNNLANCLIIDEDYSEALKNAEKAIELDRSSNYAFDTRAEIKFFLKDYSGAISDCNTAITLSQEDLIANSYLTRGRAKFELKDTKGACSDWYTAKQLGENKADEYLNLYCPQAPAERRMERKHEL